MEEEEVIWERSAESYMVHYTPESHWNIHTLDLVGIRFTLNQYNLELWATEVLHSPFCSDLVDSKLRPLKLRD
jgi:hypothetical protein